MSPILLVIFILFYYSFSRRRISRQRRLEHRPENPPCAYHRPAKRLDLLDLRRAGRQRPGHQGEALTTRDLGADAPKYVAVKHFFRHIRPNAQRIGAAVSDNSNLKASAYIHDEQGVLSMVLVNTSPKAVTASVMLPQNLEAGSLDAYTSSENNYWQASTADVQNGSAEINVPGYGVVTLTAAGLTTNLEPVQPAAFQLKHFPNPFREQTTIRYILPAPNASGSASAIPPEKQSAYWSMKNWRPVRRKPFSDLTIYLRAYIFYTSK